MKYLIASLFISCCLPLSLIGLSIDNYSAATNDRHANDASFILNDIITPEHPSGIDFSLSGLGRSSDGRWGTLLSGNVFISANHHHPATNQTLKFYKTNDPNGESITRTVSGGQHIATSDLYVGKLDSAVPNGYISYAFANYTITNWTDFISSPYYNVVGYMIGHSPGTYSSDTNVAVGTNLIDQYAYVSAGGTINHSLAMIDHNPGHTDHQHHETSFISGDSGGPLFVIENSALTIVGTNWYIGGGTNGVNYIGNYANEVNNYVSLNTVPEPQTYALILSILTLGALYRRH